MIKAGPNKMEVKKLHRAFATGKKPAGLAKAMSIEEKSVQAHYDSWVKAKKTEKADPNNASQDKLSAKAPAKKE